MEHASPRKRFWTTHIRAIFIIITCTTTLFGANGYQILSIPFHPKEVALSSAGASTILTEAYGHNVNPALAGISVGQRVGVYSVFLTPFSPASYEGLPFQVYAGSYAQQISPLIGVAGTFSALGTSMPELTATGGVVRDISLGYYLFAASASLNVIPELTRGSSPPPPQTNTNTSYTSIYDEMEREKAKEPRAYVGAHRTIPARLSVGATIKGVMSYYDVGVDDGALLFDVGARFRLRRGLAFSLVGKNLGFAFQGEEGTLPLTIAAGCAYTLLKPGALTLTAGVSKERGEPVRGSLGAEYLLIGVRPPVSSLTAITLYGGVEEALDFSTFISYGFGGKFVFELFDSYLGVDFSLSSKDHLGFSLRLALDLLW